jgi:hypothetical protein
VRERQRWTGEREYRWGMRDTEREGEKGIEMGEAQRKGREREREGEIDRKGERSIQ